MPPPSRIGMVILHVGSNDASRTRKDIQIFQKLTFQNLTEIFGPDLELNNNIPKILFSFHKSSKVFSLKPI